MSTQVVKPSPSRSTKITVALIVAALVAGLALSILAIRGGDLAAAPGFLGTRASVLSDLSLLAALVVLAGLLVGYAAARSKNIPTHQYVQTAMVLLFLVLILFIMEVSFWSNVSPGLPARLGEAAYGLPAAHAALGGLAELSGLYLILLMNGWIPKPLRVRRWKTLMRATLVLYVLVAALGTATYLIWYVAP